MCIHEICRDHHDRRLRIFFLVSLFFGKQRGNLCNLRTFCAISFTDGVNLGTYCENKRTYCVILLKLSVQCEEQVLLIGLIPFQIIYAHLSRFSNCREIHIFWRHCFYSKPAVANFIWTNLTYVCVETKSM